MVFNCKIDAKTKALVKFLREESSQRDHKETRSFKRDRLTVYRCLKPDETKSNHKSPGRPLFITSREERITERNIKKLRKRKGTFCDRIRPESGLHHVRCILSIQL